MTLNIIIIICVLLLLAYIFDLTASKTKIPSVILLLFLGWIVRQGFLLLDFQIPDLTIFLKLFGTIGLILIVLEGSLDLEFDKSKLKTIRNAFLISVISISVISFILTVIFQLFQSGSFKNCLLNAIPFGIISSAIAIPSVKHLPARQKEFVVYESSLSDILGVVVFNFFLFHEVVNLQAFGHFGFQLLILTVISFVATIILSILLSKIEHHIKFIPIVILIVLIYAVSEVFHLPALIFILIFGLFIGNICRLKEINLIKKLKPEIINKEVNRFYDLIKEVTFLIRALFFLIFGFLIETQELINPSSLLISVLIVAIIFLFRWAVFKLFKMEINPLAYIAPRGLITILLFLSIPKVMNIDFVTKSLIIQVVILSTLVMMTGLLISKNKQSGKNSQSEKKDLDQSSNTIEA
ncbi:MAG: cation:proton antiporter [Bacteroidales bacterium]|nr:cation:proton antiporter [Bacteroidales bacterium]